MSDHIAPEDMKITYTTTNADMSAFHRLFDEALASLREAAGAEHPIYIGGEAITVDAPHIVDTSPIEKVPRRTGSRGFSSPPAFSAAGSIGVAETVGPLRRSQPPTTIARAARAPTPMLALIRGKVPSFRDAPDSDRTHSVPYAAEGVGFQPRGRPPSNAHVQKFADVVAHPLELFVAEIRILDPEGLLRVGAG